MRERIHQLAEGRTDITQPSLELLVTSIEETLAAGQNYRGDIRITSGNGLPLRGLIYSGDSRVVLLQDTFAGVSAYIPYEVQADQLEPGMELTGAFDLVYNGGETRIPYVFRVRPGAGGREGLPETLADYAKMTRENPQEAEELYEKRAFAASPWMEDMSLRAVYDGLRRSVKRGRLAEEFLIAAGEKERMEITVPQTSRSFTVGQRGISDSIRVTKKGWGALRFAVTADADWIRLDRLLFSEKDMEEDSCEIPYHLVYEEMHAGKNLGRITVTTDFAEYSIPVCAEKASEGAQGAARRRERRKEELEFMKTLLLVTAEKGDQTENLEYLQYCWEEMTGDSAPTARQKLYRAAIGLWKEERDVSAMILEDASRQIQDGRREDVDAYCAFMYLTMRVSESWEQKEQLIKILRHFEELGQGSMFQTLLLLRLDEGAASRPREVLEKLTGYYRQGSRSPFLLLEITRIYNRYPDIVHQMDDITARVLLFAARHGFLSEEAAVYVASLAGQERAGNPRFVRILKELYGAYPRDEILLGICSLLIKGECRDKEEFSWFSLGVSRDIRLTRLYDYYLYTVPEDREEPFPREIMLYFSYNSPRDLDSQRILYENLLKYYDDDRQILSSYREQMRNFVLRCAKGGLQDEHLALLYSRLLEVSDVDERLARSLPDILNACQISTDIPGFTEAIVVYGELEEEFSAPLRDGIAILPVYSDRCRILFSDGEGSRYAGEGARMKRLMKDTEALEKRCLELAPKHPMLRLKESRRILESVSRTEADLRVLKREVDAREFHRQYKREMTSCVVAAAVRRKPAWEEEILSCIHYQGISREHRLQLTRILVELGRMTEAEKQVRRIGYRDLSLDILKKLVSTTIQNGLFTKDELLIDMCCYLAREGEADENVLEYLCTHYNSSSREMAPILLRAAREGLQLSDMPERLLGQMLFTGCTQQMDEVFAVYRKQDQVNPELVHAYFVVKCDGYFFRQQKPQEMVFRFVEEMLREENREQEVPEICILALVKYYAFKGELTEEETRLGTQLLQALLRKGRVFAWMKQLSGRIRLPEEIRCREWIEYHGAAGEHLELAIRILPEMKDQKERKLILPEVVRGIYVKPVLLFAGDELHWEIRRAGGEVLDAGTMKGLESPAADESRYACLNRCQQSVRDGRRERVAEWQNDVLEYAIRDTWVDSLFAI